MDHQTIDSPGHTKAPRLNRARRAVAEIDEFLQDVLAEQTEIEVDPTPPTPTYALLAAGRLDEAEAVARMAVSDLEKEHAPSGQNVAVEHSENAFPKRASATLEGKSLTGENNNRLSLLAEALIAHGIALARLKKLEAAQATLERAIAVAEEASTPERAGLAALTMIEELEPLSRKTLLSLYEQASAGIIETRNRELQWRLIDAAKKIMIRFLGAMDSDRALEILLAPPSLQEELIGLKKG
jgi:tetratricopeptide (TPR) repeat protein